jgi:5-methylcytosine-specific restriction endonuclease McrA
MTPVQYEQKRIRERKSREKIKGTERAIEITKRNSERRRANPDQVAKQRKYAKDRASTLRLDPQWVESRRNYLNEYKRKRRITDTHFHMRELLSCHFRLAMKSRGLKKDTKTSEIFAVLGYTLDELKSHLEGLFEPWMDWSNHGNFDKSRPTWQIDHIIPQSSFHFNSIYDPDFKSCWALSNLRPLLSEANNRKGSRVIDIV